MMKRMNIDNPVSLNKQIFGYIDSPVQMQIIDSDDILCRGWYYPNEGIKSIDIFIDNTKIGTAVQSGKRFDVRAVFPQYENIENSGFIFYKNVFLENGKHTIDIRIEYGNGEFIKESRDILVDKTVCVIDRVNIELTNYCNLNCLWCAGSGDRKKGFMDFNTFITAINQIQSDNIIVNEIHLYNVGESLLHPDFCKFIKFLSELKKRPKIVLVTNATLLSDSIMDCILASHGIDVIQFSVDGGTKETFEWLRRGARWDDTLFKINCFLEKNNMHVKTGLITIDMGAHFSEEFRKLIDRVDFFDFRPPHNWTGQEELEDFHVKRTFNPHPCWFIQNNLVIFWNGELTYCCADFHGRGVFGNIHENNIKDLWKGKRLTLFRKQVSGRKKEISLCRECSIL
jgi:radical SAM protein with 4Fe4S-binding SPASM domain